MTTAETSFFLNSLRNGTAREFVQKMMLNHYSEAVMEHYQGVADREEVFRKCRYLTGEIFSRFHEIRNQPERVNQLFYSLSRKNPVRDPIWFEEFDRAYENYKHHKKLFILLEKIKPYLKGDSFCDVGCGGGDLVYFIKNQFPRFREYAGIDVMDWLTEDIKDSINFQLLDLSRPGARSRKRYDTLTCIAVLHHVGCTDESHGVFLQNLRSAISDRGRLIIEEDVILPAEDIRSNDDYRAQVEERIKEQPLFSEFMQLGPGDQKDAFILIDLCANALVGGVLDMAFPFGFRTISQWCDLFMEHGYEIEDVRITGFQNGLFNRSSHVYYVLKPG